MITDRSRDLLIHLLRILVEHGGSDLHLKPGAPPRVRVDGRLLPVPGGQRLTSEDVAALAEVVLIDRGDADLQTRGAVDVAVSTPVGRFRGHVFRQLGELAVVMRRVSDGAPSIEELGLPEAATRFAELPRGLVLVCGPTGSGKTTTLAAMVDHVNRNRDGHVVSIEDPVEILHVESRCSISQRQVGSDVPTYLEGIRAAVREDPDVVVIGEVRDAETADAALGAAAAGHLVLASLHTVDAAETVERMVQLVGASDGRAREVLAATLRGVLCQRLVRRAGGSGRVAAIEVLVANGRVQQAILGKRTSESIQSIVADGEWYGMRTFDQVLAGLVAEGTVEIDDAMATASNPHDLRIALRRRGVGVDLTDAELHGTPPPPRDRGYGRDIEHGRVR